MNEDFDIELKEMAGKSKVKESEKLKESVSQICKNLKREKRPVRKWIGTVAASVACVLILGLCFPTYAQNIPGVKQALNFLNSKFGLEGYSDYATDVSYSVNVEGYTLNIEDIYYNGRELSVFYNVIGEEKLDLYNKYWFEAELDFKKKSAYEYGLEYGEFIDDNTYAGMISFNIIPNDGSKLPEVFNLEMDITKVRIQNTQGDNKDLETASISVNSDPIKLSLDSSNVVFADYTINKEIVSEYGNINIANVKTYESGIFIESSIKTTSIEQNIGYILWDSKKGELGMVVGNHIDDEMISYQYRLPSEDGELYIIPYGNTSYGPFNLQEDNRVEEYLIEAGKSYDFGDYGTIEIRDIVQEENETLVKVRSTGAQSRIYFNLINGKKGGYFQPAYEKDKKILGILDMEVTYVFNKLDPSENYYIQVPIDDEKTDFKILTDDVIKLEVN